MSEITKENTRKRPHEEGEEDAVQEKFTKIHPFFTKKSVLQPTGTFKWLKSLGPAGTCLHGVNLDPKSSPKVAAFDLDGTVIKYDTGAKSDEWEWWRTSVPKKLQELHEQGYAVILISNQCIKPKALKAWKEKVNSVAKALAAVPFRIFAATAKDNYRKPMPGMWNELERTFREDRVEIDKGQSFFVGDAAGRVFAGGKADFSSTDRKWAINIGLTFHTPEEYFLNLPVHSKIKLPGFHVSSLPDLPVVTPSSTPLLPTRTKPEIVIFVGYPCLGKSSLFRRIFEPAGYIHVNQDILKTRDKCIKATEIALRDGKACVIDNTNRNAATRKYYIDLAKSFDIPIRCMVFTSSLDLAWHNNLYRAYNLPPSVATTEPKRDLVPYSAFCGFRDNYEEPRREEGFSEVKNINWVFQGTGEEKRYWSMWLQIDGK